MMRRCWVHATVPLYKIRESAVRWLLWVCPTVHGCVGAGSGAVLVDAVERCRCQCYAMFDDGHQTWQLASNG